MSVESLTLFGPCARQGAPFVVLESGTGVRLYCQLDSGLDISHITGTRWPFHCRSVPDSVADGAYVRASLGTLYHALGVLPAWNSTTLPGFHEHTGLHAGLSGITTAREVMPRDIDGGASITVGYNIGPGITGNYFSQAIYATRTVMLYEEPLGNQKCVIIARDDEFEMQRECHMGHLEHPNVKFRRGDRICYNPGALTCLRDRDGETPRGLNPFAGFDPEALSQFHAERCFLLHVLQVCPMGGESVVPMLLLAEDGTGLGFNSLPSENLPSWVMCWFSAMSDTDGEGVGSIEFGTLPFGAERAIALGLMPKLPKGAVVRRRTKIYLLDTPELVAAFVSRYGIETDASRYPTDIGPDADPTLSRYDQATSEFPALRAAAGLPPLD